MSTFEHKNSLRTIEAQIVQKLKNNEARPKFIGSYKRKACTQLYKNNEAQICPKIKNKLRAIEARLQM